MIGLGLLVYERYALPCSVTPGGRRTALRNVQQAYALIREDIDEVNVQRRDLVA